MSKQTKENARAGDNLNSLVGIELWHIWDSKDGQSIVVKSTDYKKFCENTERDYWGFDVSKIELGKPMDHCEYIDTHDIHCEIDDNSNASSESCRK